MPREVGGAIIDETTDDARPEPHDARPDTPDDARPDQIESEMLFGETIAWMRPNSPLFRPDPEAAPEPEPPPPTAGQPAGAEPTFDVFAPPPDPASSDDGEDTGHDRRKVLVVAAAALVIVVAGAAAVVLTTGGGDDTDVSTANPGITTTAAPTTAAPASTIPPAQGEEHQTAEGTSVTVNADVLFDVNSSALTSEASSRLGAFLTLAARDPKRRLLVEGYTDGDGDAGFNQRLSEARAQSVAQWLIGKGIDPARISAAGHGPDNPVAPNDTPEHKALNRRVVVTLLNPGA